MKYKKEFIKKVLFYPFIGKKKEKKNKHESHTLVFQFTLSIFQYKIMLCILRYI